MIFEPSPIEREYLPVAAGAWALESYALRLSERHARCHGSLPAGNQLVGWPRHCNICPAAEFSIEVYESHMSPVPPTLTDLRAMAARRFAKRVAWAAASTFAAALTRRLRSRSRARMSSACAWRYLR